MKILKFGGKSLQPGSPLHKTLEIIIRVAKEGQIAIVVSALGNSTDRLVQLADLAQNGADLEDQFLDFVRFQNGSEFGIELNDIFLDLRNDLDGLTHQGYHSTVSYDKILSYGEILSAKIVAHELRKHGLFAEFVDARLFLKGNNIDSEFTINQKLSRQLTIEYFDEMPEKVIPVITGFIAEDDKKQTVTLGRNGTNYSTSLIANFLEAAEVQNWTDVNGIYAASPKLVAEAQHISHLSYKEAHELANFGASILHPKTIGPLMEKNIPLRIFNSFSNSDTGTTVSNEGSEKGIKAVSVIEDVALIAIEGKGLLGRVGIDARIFTALSKKNISVRLISQASSERGIGFVVDADAAKLATAVLSEEFAVELIHKDISKIGYNLDMAIIAIVGRHNYSLEKAIKGLRRNKIWMHLISNSISGEHISLVIDNKDIKKAVNIVHSQVFGVIKTINLFAFGKGTVGDIFLNQILDTPDEIVKRRNLRIRIIGVADSRGYIFDPTGLGKDWKEKLESSQNSLDLSAITQELVDSGLENIVIADNTSSQEVANHYSSFLKNSIDIVASNKKANSCSYEAYQEIRELINKRGRLFHYETNVGAGLPLIDTIKHLRDSADQIVRIRGVFSGSLSYIFNNFSKGDKCFSKIILEAKDLGLTESDPREDLSGQDVARKLLILARELGLKSEWQDIQLTNLIPDSIGLKGSFDDFITNSNQLDQFFNIKRAALNENEVLRYVGDLEVNSGVLKVGLIIVPRTSPIGSINNADALFEIFTESYGEQPLVIQGAGAGGAVTARGVYSDLIRMGHKY